MENQVLLSSFMLLAASFIYAGNIEARGLSCSKRQCSREFADELKKAEAGDANAQNKVGEMLHFGRGVEKDYLAAKEWYLKATNGGHAVAPNHLGRLFLNGEGVAKDAVEACRWYKLSAERGDAFGKGNFEFCTRKGYAKS